MDLITAGRLLLGTLLAAVAGLISPGLAGASDPYPAVPTPTVTGPVQVSSSSYPFLATDLDLSRYGYVEEEFFITGRAYRYDTSGSPRPVDQTATRIETGGSNADGTYPFKTRIVVRRPANPADANGTVVAEWNNVTAGRDIEWNWFGDPEFMLRNGYTFVGVTAQWAGVNGLRAFDPARYADLEVRWAPGNPSGPTTDDLSYDIYGAALKAIKGAGTGEDPLRGIEAKTVIASGESQSCGRLASHYNFVQPLQEIADAYLLTVCGSPLRTNRPEKAVRILTETENRTERPASTFPDTDSIRHWEVAGSSHLPRLAWDNAAGLINRDYLPLTVSCTKFPLSLVQWPFTVNRAIAGLVAWSSNESAALPVAPRGQYRNGELLRDAFGIAKGGIRYPDLTVPTAVNDGVNESAGSSPFDAFCGLLGSSTPFGSAALSRLYRDHGEYVNSYSRAADKFRKTGFILAEDVTRLKRISRQYPRLRPTAPRLTGRSGNGSQPRLAWTGSEAPGTTFVLQRARVQGKGKLRWSNVSARISGSKAVLNRQPKGTWRYRVRGSSVIPANNIAPAERVTTPFSAPGKPVKIKR